MIAATALSQLLSEMAEVELELGVILSKKTGCEVCTQSALAFTKLREGYSKLFAVQAADKILV
jgi:hypothetical protein